MPAGSSRIDLVDRAAVLADHQHVLAVVLERHDDDRAGVADDVALEGEARRVDEGAGDELEEGSPNRSRSPMKRNELGSGNGITFDREQVRVATTGAHERRVDEPSEERVWPVRAALELRMRLGADPEAVPRQLDELDQPVVGRGPRAAPGRPPRGAGGSGC